MSLAEQARVSGTVGLYTSLQNVISESRLSNKVVELQERVVEHPFIITLCALAVTVGLHCLSFHACIILHVIKFCHSFLEVIARTNGQVLALSATTSNILHIFKILSILSLKWTSEVLFM